MAANFGLVVHAAQRNTLELAAQGPGNGAPSWSCHAGGPQSTEWTLHVRLEFEHAEIVEDAVLHSSVRSGLIQNLLALAMSTLAPELCPTQQASTRLVA